ncbi:MAG: L,D-transpeptidase family protein [Planctomycetota bacterium]
MFTGSRRRSRSKSRGRSRKGGRSSGPGAGVKALVVAGVAAGGWLGVKAYRGEAAAPPALSAAPVQVVEGEDTPLATPEAGPAPAASPVGQRIEGPVPAALRGAVARAQRSKDPLALNELRKLVVEFPSSPEAAQAEQALADARGTAERRAQEAANPADALREWTRVYLATVDADARKALRPHLAELVQAVFYARGASTNLVEYKVQPGDSLGKIAKKHGTDYRFMKRLNGLTRDTIRVGQALRVPQASVRIAVYKRDFELIALFGDHYLCSYDVATGKEDRTPEAEFVIGNKIVKPDWYAPDGKKYAYGTEENILGTRWMAFENTPEHNGFGIHGTKFPESIGSEASMGCLRMRNEEVEVLFDLIPPGTKVFIQR